MIINQIAAGGMQNLVNSVTYTGANASALSARANSFGCNADGEVLIIQQGASTSANENIVFSLASAPSGVTLKGTYSVMWGTANPVGQMFGCILQGVTAPIDITLDCGSVNGTYDYYPIAITATLA